MIACENPECAIEWYHFACVGLKADVSCISQQRLHFITPTDTVPFQFHSSPGSLGSALSVESSKFTSESSPNSFVVLMVKFHGDFHFFNIEFINNHCKSCNETTRKITLWLKWRPSPRRPPFSCDQQQTSAPAQQQPEQ